jgi:hypothetical protein
VRSILDAHFLHRDPALARSAINKLKSFYLQKLAETGTNLEPQSGLESPMRRTAKI